MFHPALRHYCVLIVFMYAFTAFAQSTIEKLDPNMATLDAKGEWRWFDGHKLTVEGMGWTDTEKPYARFPARAKGKIDNNVWSLSQHSAGIAIHFQSNAQTIAVRWTLLSNNLSMPHMPATGVSGLDLYMKQGKGWHWIGNARPNTDITTEATIVKGIPEGSHEFCLYLPLYNGVESISIGIPPTADMAKTPVRPKPICFYGTSILHGGCASRPGMAYPSILGRRFDVPVINLGFSGNGKMQPEVVDLLAELNVRAYVLDSAPNMPPEMIRERVVPTVQKLRAAHPDTPILLVENILYQAGVVLPGPKASTDDKNTALREAYKTLKKQGIRGLYYCPGDKLLGHDGEATVDGTHPTDLGFMRMADAIEPFIRKMLHKAQ